MPDLPQAEPLKEEKAEVDKEIKTELNAAPAAAVVVGGTQAESAPSPEPADEVTDKAVDDIVAKEGDTVLEAEDANLKKAFEPSKGGWKEKIKDFVSRWWNNKKVRWITLSGVGVLLLILLFVPVTRYFILNGLSIRSSASVTVLDDSTQQPLKNVTVWLSGQSSQTDQNGVAKLYHLKLGGTELSISRIAFASHKQHVTLGWGSNPLGQFKLTPVGQQYSFLVTDWLSGKPIAKAEATAGESNAEGDNSGKVVLTTDSQDTQNIMVTISADGYRDEELSFVPTTQGEQKVKLVPARKEVFVSKRSGKYDLYKIDLDGKNEKLLLAGTGSERDDISLVPHPTDEQVALVSTRSGTQNSDGYLLSDLNLVDVETGNAKKIVSSEQIQLVGWTGTHLVYVQVAAGTSAANPKRNRLMSYDYKAGTNKEISAANSYNAVVLVSGNIYYTTGSFQAGTIGLIKIDPSGNNQQTLLGSETWSIFRTSYNKLTLDVQQDWYEYKIGDSKATKLTTSPANVHSRIYADSPDGKLSVWSEDRDGKGTLLTYDIGAGTDKVIKAQSGLRNPIRWINNSTIVYRVVSPSETADYVLNIEGGDAHKIKDVTNTSGIERSYYY